MPFEINFLTEFFDKRKDILVCSLTILSLKKIIRTRKQIDDKNVIQSFIVIVLHEIFLF